MINFKCFLIRKKNRKCCNTIFSKNKTKDRHFFWFKGQRASWYTHACNISPWFQCLINFSILGHATKTLVYLRLNQITSMLKIGMVWFGLVKTTSCTCARDASMSILMLGNIYIYALVETCICLCLGWDIYLSMLGLRQV